MKHILPLAFSVLFFSTSNAQLTGISVEEYVDHTTTGIAELEGFITYRVYVDSRIHLMKFQRYTVTLPLHWY
jgi:hypothetical protein